MSFNQRIFAILNESGKACKSKVTKTECDDACSSFADTIGNGHNFSDVIVPSSIKMNEEKVPIEKAKVECGESCKEAYFLDSRVLDIYMEDNNIEDDSVAVENICEYFGIDLDDMYVVVEGDDCCKDLIDFAKDSSNYASLGLLKKAGNRIQCLVNKGIHVCKK